MADVCMLDGLVEDVLVDVYVEDGLVGDGLTDVNICRMDW